MWLLGFIIQETGFIRLWCATWFLLEGYKMDQLPDVKEVLKELYENSRPFKEIKKFSDSPGIYGVFFYGSEFPLKDL